MYLRSLFLLVMCTAQLIAARAQKNIQYRSNLKYTQTLSNVWGYTDTVTGREYALVGEETGLSIVDVTDPQAPNELFFVPTDTSIWKEPKNWGAYAYCTNEKGGGLLIVDMTQLPNFVSYTNWSAVPGQNYRTSHSLFIDEKGFLYLNGSNLFNKGVLICDLKPNPMSPVYLAAYDDFYVHDCFARNDTLFTAEILNGQFSVLDVADKSNIKLLARQTTPFFFSHNVWPSDDGRFLFNTDEKKFAPVTAYDISNLDNIKEIDQYRHSDFDSSIPHNTHYRDGYLYTSYYRDGVTIVDAHRPDNLVEVGHYDTSPFPSGDGFEGCWGVYPYFPSGNIVCSDRQEGLFVLTPTLKRACYLEGKVTNAQNGVPLPGIMVEVMGVPRLKPTNLTGNYKTGVADSGLYDIRFIDYNNFCITRIISGVELKPAAVTTLNTTLACNFPTAVLNLQDGIVKMYAAPSVFAEYTELFIENTRAEDLSIVIYDIEGRVMQRYSITTPQAQIQVGAHWPAGTYTVHASNQQVHKTVRIVKQ